MLKRIKARPVSLFYEATRELRRAALADKAKRDSRQNNKKSLREELKSISNWS